MVRTSGAVRQASKSPAIAGGFVLVEVSSLIGAWEACRVAPLGIGDFRAWLACREMLARRCTLGEGRAPAYSLDELASLLGINRRRAGASLRRLQAAGLIEWSEAAIAFPKPPGPISGGPTPPDPIRDSLGGGRGSLTIPRRILRFMADGSRPALIATVLGILLRCLSRRGDDFGSRGRAKAAWIARAFGVEPRRVKQARSDLVALGWITPEDSDQWSLNRWGRAYRIDLDWAPARREDLPNGPRLAPPSGDPGPTLAPPDLHREALRGEKNQEPASGRLAGISLEGSAGESQATESKSSLTPINPPGSYSAVAIPRASSAGSHQAERRSSSAARLDDVLVEDLKDTGRLLDLHGQAVNRGLVGPSEADRLRFVAAAEHAMALGKENPPGLFMHLIRGRLWRYLTQRDEDRANGRIKRQQRCDPVAEQRRWSVAEPRPGTCGTGLSGDALLVRKVREALIRAGIFGDAFAEFRRVNPDWTRERWDVAWEEANSASGVVA